MTLGLMKIKFTINNLIQEYYRSSKKNKPNNEEDIQSDNEIYIRHRHQPFVIDLPSSRFDRMSRRSST